MARRPLVSLVVAADRRGGIGRAGTLPWLVARPIDPARTIRDGHEQQQRQQQPASLDPSEMKPFGSLRADMKRFRELTTTVPPELAAERQAANVIIMGRATWWSIPKKFRPLANRINVVLTRNQQAFRERMAKEHPHVAVCDVTAKDREVIKGANALDEHSLRLPSSDDAGAHDTPQIDDHSVIYVAESLNDALACVTSPDFKCFVAEVFVIGGAKVFEDSLPICDRVYFTEVDADFDCDTFFSTDLLADDSFDVHDQSEWAEERGLRYRFHTLSRARGERQKNRQDEHGLNRTSDKLRAGSR